MNTMQQESLANARPALNSMQSEFDAVVDHLYKQGRPARVDFSSQGGLCKYRLEQDDGTVLKCAVGCRIPDDKYSPRMDTMSSSRVYDIIDEFYDALPREIVEYARLFSALQTVHDSQDRDGFDFKHLEEDLERVAKEFDLTFTKPEGY